MKENKEIWVDVIGYEGLYKVSNWGRVLSLKRAVTYQGKTYNIDGRLRKQMNNGNGYLNLTLCKNGISERIYIHRLVACHFIENTNSYKEVNHIDGIKSNNHSYNLEWCNRSMNLKHAFKSGLKIPSDISGKKNPKFRHGKLIRFNKEKVCVICGKTFMARLAHISHCSRSCTTIHTNRNRAALKEEIKMQNYSNSIL
ncbi:MAG TPA: NUMOD4 domain-containing protein [Agriterribacter sp.]|uniref:NUMOD4 domain-containing protein n=1 Tax=Agriterribacter sp. TaxID=2821509 RepID=UPI002CB3B18E|nr:NUMOD4 domain-containing protein [Agriterribacter sp.]HRQ17736.1 NUMOD4 domain-containing protein [Agriterribacter sp.]